VRGSHDDQILTTQVLTEVDQTAPAERPPGGKPLARLLLLLESRGYEALAAASIRAAVPEESRELFYSRMERFTASPTQHMTRAVDAPGTLKPGETSEAASSAAASIAEGHIAAAQQTGPATGSGPQWRSLGPATIPNGQTYNSAVRVNVSGRVAAIAVDPRNPAHVLCGAANGGVWESFDRGGSWAPRTDYAATTAVGALAFSPGNPSIVYCGTGEGNWWWWLGTGILRSSDGGTTWSTLCTAPFVGQGFYDLRVDPANVNHLVAATTGGLYDSSDGGSNWTARRSVRTWALAFGSSEILGSSADGVC